uniref:Uncharacterized protein n=1 Tax=Salix viminalis TaxID=40686 RepID=A0A6N2KZ66_SALVM
MLLPPTGLKYLSNKLIYFHWNGFPSRSLPQNFCAEHLVELNLSRSKVEKLWTGVQDIGNLRNFVLSYSPYLIELPDLSKAKNLVRLYLVDCSSLTEVPSSLQHLDKLEELDLYFCYNLRRFPMLDSKALRVLALSRCLDMTKFPTISQNMKRLYLEETSLKEVPQSVTSKLEHLGLHGCSKITKFPEISGDIKTLYLSETAITEVPSSIQFLKKLSVLDMSGCPKLESFPEITVPMKSFVDLNLSKTGIKEIPSSFKHMISLRSLGLEGTPIKELPLSIKDMSGEKIPHDRIQMILPGSEIPEWFAKGDARRLGVNVDLVNLTWRLQFKVSEVMLEEKTDGSIFSLHEALVWLLLFALKTQEINPFSSTSPFNEIIPSVQQSDDSADWLDLLSGDNMFSDPLSQPVTQFNVHEGATGDMPAQCTGSAGNSLSQ